MSADQTFSGMIFDFNGVLLWDSHLHQQAWSRTAVELRGTPIDEHEMDHAVHGRTNDAILGHLLGRPVAGDELARLAERKEAAYRHLCLELGDGFRLSPGAEPLLDALAEARIPLTIATASPGPNLDFFFRHLSLERWFDRQRVAFDDGSFPGKPAPDIYLRAAGHLGVDPADCVVVEDALSGIEAARRAGIGRVYALGPAERHRELRAQAGTYATLTRLDELAVGLFASPALARSGP